jgi:tetratricopeptide (TPR) repeat protein
MSGKVTFPVRGGGRTETMTNEPDLKTMTQEERQRLRKQLGDQAVKAAISSRWAEAASANREFLRIFGDEAEAHNRLGKAQTELGQVTDARKSYGRAIELDPTNTIARRNLDRLATMKDTAVASAAPSQLDTRLFVEETGSSTVARLQATDAALVQLLDAGDLVELRVQGNAVNVHNTNGEYVGMVEPRIGLRLSKLMTTGNDYAAAIVTTQGEPRVVIRETFQHAANIGKVSFPQSRTTDIRAYTRKGLLRKEGDDFEYGDDEVEDEEERSGWSETTDEADRTTAEVDIEAEDESFD